MSYSFNWSAVSGGAPYITISSLGIAFNSTSIAKLGTPKKIVIGFDEDKLAIGIKVYNGEPDVKPYEFSDRIRNGWIRIGCKDFIKYLQSITDIDFSVARKYVARYEQPQGILVVLVSEEVDLKDG